MSRATAVAAVATVALFAAACGDNLGPPLASTDRRGGSITPPGCAHRVVTRLGADAPRLGDDAIGPDPTPRLVRLGLVGDPRTSIAIGWRTVDEVTTAGRVRYGVVDLDREVAALTFSYVTNFGNGDVVRMHEAHLCDLAPDTAYRYQIESGGATSPTYEFRTAPEPSPDGEITIAVAGDSRGGYDVWGRLALELVARAPDLVVWSGDAVLLGQLQPEWDAFFAAGEPLLARVPIAAAHGNHEVGAVNHYAQFALPGDEEHYVLDYGPIRLITVNDSPDDPARLDGAIRSFLTRALAQTPRAPWTIVNHHRPLYSASFHGSDLGLRASWAPLFEAAGVELVINGHEHSYERTHPMRGDAPGAGGPVYLVSGGAGAPLYEVGTGPWTAVAGSVHHAALVRVRPGLLQVEAFDQDGVELDRFALVKP